MQLVEVVYLLMYFFFFFFVTAEGSGLERCKHSENAAVNKLNLDRLSPARTTDDTDCNSFTGHKTKYHKKPWNVGAIYN